MENLTVILAGSLKPISLCIQLKSGCIYSHCAVLLPDLNTVVESVGGVGVKYTSLADFKKRYGWWCIGEIPCANLETALATAKKYVDAKVPYDNSLTFFQLIGLYVDDINALNCSEKIAKLSGLYRDDSTKYIRPVHLFWQCTFILESYSKFKFIKPTKVGACRVVL